MCTIFTEKNTGFEDKEVIKRMNDELANVLHILKEKSSVNAQSNQLLKNTRQEYAMYEILLKYKNDYYNNLNVLYVGDEPPDFLGEDSFIQKMDRSLTKKCEMLFNKYDNLMEQARPYFEEYNRISVNLKGTKINNVENK